MERNYTSVLLALLLVVALMLIFVTAVTRKPDYNYSSSSTCIALVGCNGLDD